MTMGSIGSKLEDARWREAAETLGLELWNARGKKAKSGQGGRAHEMRGSIDGFALRVRYGLQDVEDKIMVIEVTLSRPLMLGFVYRVTGAVRDYRGRRLTAKHIDVVGIERDRVRRMVEDTTSGVELAELANQYGDTGWVEIDDTKVRAHLESYTDFSKGYAPPVRTALELARLAEAARKEIGAVPWEGELASNLAKAADSLRLKVDSQRFRLRGRIRGMTTAIRLETVSAYALSARIALPTSLPDGVEISARVGCWSKLLARLRLDRASGDPTFDSFFQVKGSVRDRLLPRVTAALVALSAKGDVHVKSDAITLRTSELTLDISQLLQQLAMTAEMLLGPKTTSPYRD